MNARMNDGTTPIYAAVYNKHAKAIRALKAAGADVNTPDSEGKTPIFIAAYNGHVEAINVLKAAGANVNMPNNNGITPISIASFKGHVAAIGALKAAGADVNIPDSEGKTPIFIAAYNGHVEVINALKALGANVNMPNNNGITPISIAAFNGQAAAITALKAAGAAIDIPEKTIGATPVYMAAQGGHARAITALKAGGADVDIPTNDGRTPIFIAAYNGHAEAVSALLEAKADARSRKAALEIALEQGRKVKGRGHQEIVRLLEAHFKQPPDGIEVMNQEAVSYLSNPPQQAENLLFHLGTSIAKEQQMAKSDTRFPEDIRGSSLKSPLEITSTKKIKSVTEKQKESEKIITESLTQRTAASQRDAQGSLEEMPFISGGATTSGSSSEQLISENKKLLASDSTMKTISDIEPTSFWQGKFSLSIREFFEYFLGLLSIAFIVHKIITTFKSADTEKAAPSIQNAQNETKKASN